MIKRYRCPLHRCGCWHTKHTLESPVGVDRAHRRDAYRILDRAEVRERNRRAKPGRKNTTA